MTPPRTSLSLRVRGKIPVFLAAVRDIKFVRGILVVLGRLGRKVNGGPVLQRTLTILGAERLQKATEKVRAHYVSVANRPLAKMATTKSRRAIIWDERPPPLSAEQLAALRVKLSELLRKREAEREAEALAAASRAEEADKKAEEDASKTSTLLGGVAKYVAPIPSYITDTAKGLMANKAAEESAGVSARESTPAKDGATLTKEKKGGETVPRWKLHEGPATSATTSMQSATGALVRAVKAADADACLRDLEDLSSHLHKHPWSKGLAVREGVVGALLFIRWRTQNMAVKMQASEALDLVGYQPPVPKVGRDGICFSPLRRLSTFTVLEYTLYQPCFQRGIRILCLDGGGMRGIVALEVLRELEAATGRRIHELFDFICGVSTGAIIASFLGFHKKTIDEIEEIYKRLGREIFTRNLIKGTTGWITSHSFYDSKNYERILQGFVGGMTMSDTVRTPGTPKVAIVSTLVSEEKISPFIFRVHDLTTSDK